VCLLLKCALYYFILIYSCVESQAKNAEFTKKEYACKGGISVLKVDCGQSLLSSKIRGEERKTSKRASVNISVMCERRCCEPLTSTIAPHRHSHARTPTSSALLTTDLRGKEKLPAVYPERATGSCFPGKGRKFRSRAYVQAEVLFLTSQRS